MVQWATVLVSAVALAVVAAQARSGIDAKASAPFGDEPVTPIPLTTNLVPAKVRLGERLFHDVRLSRGNVIACATCHRLAEGGDDGLARVGRHDKLTPLTGWIANAIKVLRL